MPKTTYQKILFPLVSLLVLFSTERVLAQLAIGAPNLEFTQACANDTFNSFGATFVFTPEENLGPNNQFIVEMSNAEGDFEEPTTVYTSAQGEITTSPATIYFPLPVETAGEGYKIRIKATKPEATSARSDAFAAYYKIQDTPFTINDLEPTAVFCPGGSYILTIDNPGTGDNDSPLNYPQLTFNWFRVTGDTSSEFVAKGDFLEVTQEGTYFAETDYGTCTSDSFSNRVTVTEAENGETTTANITSSLGNPFCNGNGPTTLRTIEGSSYQWSVNGAEISGATSREYITDQSGRYSVVVGIGGCEAIGAIDLVAGDFQAALDVPPTNELQAGETLFVTVTTDAENPTFEWFLNGEIIPDATENTFEATEYGSYIVAVTQTVGCNATKELSFEITEIFDPFPEVDNIPNLISPNGDGVNDTWVIPIEYTRGTETEVMILSSQGKIVYQTKEYANNWPEDQMSLKAVNEVFYYVIAPKGQATKKGSITIVR